MKKVDLQVELAVTKTEFYDFIVQVEVEDDVDTSSEDFHVEDYYDDASETARGRYWSGDQKPYDAQPNEFETINVELWD